LRIWIDADACPGPVKEMVLRASRRTGIPVTLVANRPLFSGSSPLVNAVSVEQTLDAADHYLVQHAQSGDLVITADIPLAARLVAGGRAVLNPRGEVYTVENIAERLSLRDFKEALRATGTITGGPAPYHDRDKRAFANGLDRWLAKNQPHPP